MQTRHPVFADLNLPYSIPPNKKNALTLNPVNSFLVVDIGAGLQINLGSA